MKRNKPMTILLTEDYLRHLQQWREANGVSYSDMLTAELSSMNATDVLDVPVHPYGSGRVPKVFRLPKAAEDQIETLANQSGRTRSAVVEAAFTRFMLRWEKEHKNQPPNGILAQYPDDLLTAELVRRGLRVTR